LLLLKLLFPAIRLFGGTQLINLLIFKSKCYDAKVKPIPSSDPDADKEQICRMVPELPSKAMPAPTCNLEHGCSQLTAGRIERTIGYMYLILGLGALRFGTSRPRSFFFLVSLLHPVPLWR
jgi:hypothetical protein